jgi:hypothetical protein
MSGSISVKVRGLGELKDFISTLPRRVRGVATEAAAEYLVGNGQRGLKRYPPYKYITRRQAYGKTFVSDKQRRYVMAAIADGRIDPGAPHRTGAYQRSIEVVGRGAQAVIRGELPHERWTDRLSRKVGWRNWDEIIASNFAGAIQAAERAVDKIIGKGVK